MLRGFLARVEYLKPALKQDGLVMEHMRDIEWYYHKLKSLYDNCHKIEKTLEAAYDTLSRKVTICMELRPNERFGQTSYEESEKPIDHSNTSYEKASMDDFDEAPKGVVATKKEKVGLMDWSDF